jgi:hypothetical protein
MLNSMFVSTMVEDAGTVQFPYLDTWKVFKECREGGVGIHLASVCDSANTTSSKTLLSVTLE